MIRLTSRALLLVCFPMGGEAQGAAGTRLKSAARIDAEFPTKGAHVVDVDDDGLNSLRRHP